jgi:hypothetical protein
VSGSRGGSRRGGRRRGAAGLGSVRGGQRDAAGPAGGGSEMRRPSWSWVAVTRSRGVCRHQVVVEPPPNEGKGHTSRYAAPNGPRYVHERAGIRPENTAQTGNRHPTASGGTTTTSKCRRKPPPNRVTATQRLPCGAWAAVHHPSVQRSTRRPAAQRSSHPTVQPTNHPTIQHPAAHDPRPLGPVAKPRRRIPAGWP